MGCNCLILSERIRVQTSSFLKCVRRNPKLPLFKNLVDFVLSVLHCLFAGIVQPFKKQLESARLNACFFFFGKMFIYLFVCLFVSFSSSGSGSYFPSFCSDCIFKPLGDHGNMERSIQGA